MSSREPHIVWGLLRDRQCRGPQRGLGLPHEKLALLVRVRRYVDALNRMLPTGVDSESQPEPGHAGALPDFELGSIVNRNWEAKRGDMIFVGCRRLARISFASGRNDMSVSAPSQQLSWVRND